MTPTPWLVVPAAGQGKRMGADRPKQYLDLAGEPLLRHTLRRLHAAFPEARCVICLDDDDRWFRDAWMPFARWQRVSGGTERMDSVLNALHAMAADANDPVLVHDVARPCVMPNDLKALYQAALESAGGALLAMPVADTMKRDNGDGASLRTESRDGLWHALTPQGFRHGLLLRALTKAQRSGTLVTDEASAIEALGLAPRLVSARRDNIKVTHPGDLGFAAAILSAQAGEIHKAESGHEIALAATRS